MSASRCCRVFPKVFRLATVFGGIAIVSGVGLLAWYAQLDLTRLGTTTWGWRVLAGGSLGGVLYAFRLFQESGMERSLAAHLVFLTDEDDPSAAQSQLRHLALFPRIGVLVLLLVIGLMSAAARLLWTAHCGCVVIALCRTTIDGHWSGADAFSARSNRSRIACRHSSP